MVRNGHLYGYPQQRAGGAKQPKPRRQKMQNTRSNRLLFRCTVSRIPDSDLETVVGGMNGPYPQQLTFPPLPSVPQRSFTLPMPSSSPFKISTAHSGGTNRTSNHSINAAYDGPKLSANIQAVHPAPPAMAPPLPGPLNGNMPPMPQGFTAQLGYKVRF